MSGFSLVLVLQKKQENPTIDVAKIQIYCCPVNFKTAEKSSPKPFRIGLRAFFFEKQAPLIK